MLWVSHCSIIMPFFLFLSSAVLNMACNGKRPTLEEPDKVVASEGPHGEQARDFVGLVGEGVHVDKVVPVDSLSGDSTQTLSSSAEKR